MDDIRIRTAASDDAEQILAVYAPYVKDTAIPFEYDVPSLEEFRGRIEKTLKRYPYLVAECGGEILGYAYSGPFVGREAYDWSCETTIYLGAKSKGMGLGKWLYQTLEDISRAQNITNLYACIAYPETDDEYLTKNSAQFHEHMGYRMAGRFCKCGCKFGRWYDMVWMEKCLAEHPENPKKVIPFPELNWHDAALHKI